MLDMKVPRCTTDKVATLMQLQSMMRAQQAKDDSLAMQLGLDGSPAKARCCLNRVMQLGNLAKLEENLNRATTLRDHHERRLNQLEAMEAARDLDNDVKRQRSVGSSGFESSDEADEAF